MLTVASGEIGPWISIFNFLSLLIDKDNKKINFDFEDEIVNSVVLTYQGEIRLELFK